MIDITTTQFNYENLSESALRAAFEETSIFKRMPIDVIFSILNQLENTKDLRSVRVTSRLLYRESEKILVSLFASRLNIPVILSTRLEELECMSAINRIRAKMYETTTLVNEPRGVCIQGILAFTMAGEVAAYPIAEQSYKNLLAIIASIKESRHPFFIPWFQLINFTTCDIDTKMAAFLFVDYPNETWAERIHPYFKKMYVGVWKSTEGIISFGDVPEYIKSKRENQRFFNHGYVMMD